MTNPDLFLAPDTVIKALRRFIDCNYPEWSRKDYEALYLTTGILIREAPPAPKGRAA